MLFEALHAAAQAGDLILVDGGLCHYHIRRDGQVSILEILVLPECQRQGIGTAMLARVAAETARRRAATHLLAKCPADLPSNGFWQARGFTLARTERSRRGRRLHVWVLSLS